MTLFAPDSLLMRTCSESLLVSTAYDAGRGMVGVSFAYNLSGSVASDDGIVDQEDNLVAELGLDGRQLSANALLARFLSRLA